MGLFLYEHISGEFDRINSLAYAIADKIIIAASICHY